MAWAAESIHAVVFTPPTGERPDALQPWLRLFGDSPQTYQSNEANAPSGSMAIGLVGGYQISVRAQPGRQEVIVGPAPSADGIPQPIADMGEVLSLLPNYVQKLLGSGVIRLAIVLNLVERFATQADAAVSFKEHTKLPHLPGDATDLQLGFNVRRDLSAMSGQMNRLCRWATAVQQLVALQITTDTISPGLSIQEFPVESFKIDVNTVPVSSGTIPLSAAMNVFQELVDEAKIIISQGYDRLVH